MKSLSNHRKNIPSITIFGILHTFIDMDIISDLPTLEIFLQTFFWGKKYGSKIPYLAFLCIFLLSEYSVANKCDIMAKKLWNSDDKLGHTFMGNHLDVHWNPLGVFSALSGSQNILELGRIELRKCYTPTQMHIAHAYRDMCTYNYPLSGAL